MNITEMIKQLEEIKKEHGDIEASIDTNFDLLWKTVDNINVVIQKIYYPTKSEIIYLRFG